jgi:hypothetical protein
MHPLLVYKQNLLCNKEYRCYLSLSFLSLPLSITTRYQHLALQGAREGHRATTLLVDQRRIFRSQEKKERFDCA